MYYIKSRSFFFKDLSSRILEKRKHFAFGSKENKVSLFPNHNMLINHKAEAKDRRDPRLDAERHRRGQAMAAARRGERVRATPRQPHGRVRRVRASNARRSDHRRRVHRSPRGAHQAARQGQGLRRRGAQAAPCRDAVRVQEAGRARLGAQQDRSWPGLRAGVLEEAAEGDHRRRGNQCLCGFSIFKVVFFLDLELNKKRETRRFKPTLNTKRFGNVCRRCLSSSTLYQISILHPKW